MNRITKRVSAACLALLMTASAGASSLPFSFSESKAVIVASAEGDQEQTAKQRYLTLLEEAKALSADDYSADSYAKFKDRVTVYDLSMIWMFMPGKAVASDSDYEMKALGIESTYQFLDTNKEQTNYKDLEALFNKCDNINKDDYTEESYEALTEAIGSAEKVLAKEHAKQPKIDAAKDSLQSAIDALEKKPETALDKDNLADGKYTLTAEMIKTDRKSKSMSNNAINHTVQLEVVDGKYFVTMQFKGLAIYNQFGYLKDLGYYDAGYTYNDYGIPQGTVLPAEVLSTYDTVDQYNDADNLYPQLLRFKLVDKASADFVPLQVFVPIMEAIAEGTGTQDVLMQLDWSTLVKVDDNAPIDIEEPEEQSPAGNYHKSNNPKDNKGNNNHNGCCRCDHNHNRCYNCRELQHSRHCREQRKGCSIL